MRKGWSAIYAAMPEEALRHFDRSGKLSPLAPFRFNIVLGRAAALRGLGDLDAALALVRAGMRANPGMTGAYRMILCDLVLAGREVEARVEAHAFLRHSPHASVAYVRSSWPPSVLLSQPDYADALRHCGLPGDERSGRPRPGWNSPVHAANLLRRATGTTNPMPPIIEVSDLSKTYASGTEALAGVSLDIREGEILALLGPNGAGKTTFISILCGLVTPTGGQALVAGHDIVRDYRAARSLIGLVPQEIAVEPFERVMNTLRFSRGLFGKRPDDAHLERVLRALALWDKRDARLNELSGGMKRRVLIGKALSHGPRILFLDEPTAGVDVSLRREMWAVVRDLRASGVTIILTTHYLEEAEEMADRIGIIDKGRLLLLEETAKLMHEFGRKRLTLELTEPLAALPEGLADTVAGRALTLSADGRHVTYDYDTRADRSGIARLLAGFAAAGIAVRDLETEHSSLEEVFLRLVEDSR